MHLSLFQTSFTVTDLDRSVAFYRDVLGMTLKATTEVDGEPLSTVTGYPRARLKIALMQAGDHEIELIQYVLPQGARSVPPRRDAGSAHIAFHVDDADAAYRELTDKGVRFVSPPQDFGQVNACYFLDPDGITLELIEQKGGA
ncbi:MAG: VOC family protein [Chloroflexi bacterium]|nr:VOC family protein [Chloroflexota bacterium]